MGEDWTPEEWASWAKSMEGSTWLLEKGEKVVTPPPPTPGQKARFEAFMQALSEEHGAQSDG
jgi:hypothetical protein